MNDGEQVTPLLAEDVEMALRATVDALRFFAEAPEEYSTLPYGRDNVAALVASGSLLFYIYRNL